MASLPLQHPPHPLASFPSMPPGPALLRRSGLLSLALFSSGHLRPGAWKKASEFWPLPSVPTFPRFVGNGCLVLVVLRLGHHHGGQWSHEVVLEGQVQGLGCEVLLLLAMGILTVGRGGVGGSAQDPPPPLPVGSPRIEPTSTQKKLVHQLPGTDGHALIPLWTSVSPPEKYKGLKMATATISHGSVHMLSASSFPGRAHLIEG